MFKEMVLAHIGKIDWFEKRSKFKTEDIMDKEI